MVELRHGPYLMTTYHNGLALSVVDLRDNSEFFLQGEDSGQFLDELEEFQEGTNRSFEEFLSLHEYDTLFIQP